MTTTHFSNRHVKRLMLFIMALLFSLPAVANADEHNARLQTLNLRAPPWLEFTPAFSPEITEYSARYGWNTNSIQIEVLAEEPGVTSIVLNGTRSPNAQGVFTSLPLVFGSNTLSLEVTAPDGSTRKTYVVTALRTGEPDVLPAGVVGQAYAPRRLSGTATIVGGSLPPGMTLALMGVRVMLEGTPTQAGTYLFQTADATLVERRFALTVSAAAPEVPTGVSAVAGDGSARVTWTAPVFDGGSPITGYTVTGTPAGTCTVNPGQNACVVSGLANGVPHQFTVVAANAAASSEPSASVAATPQCAAGRRLAGA